ncbi:MAG: SDR family NAD(P)-dependent oxidoreductase, partial [Gammaproteobacteria bacterium]|nr:SDR family NAD(P)-dependent oxidoreductase [Gammaproteobacteria bacterium]
MDKTALITGASAGLGKEFARQLAAQGYQLVLVARNPEPLQATAAELQHDYGVQTLVLPADLSKPEAPRQIFTSLETQGLHIDYLVNNAGIAQRRGPMLEVTEADFDRIYAVNVKSIYWGAIHAVPLL